MNDQLIGKKYSIIFVITIILLAFFFRTWHIKDVPPGMWGDEAVNANEGIRLIENREFQIFFQNLSWGGKESLFFYFVGISAKLFGVNQPWAARLASVFFGFLGVIGVYLLAKEIFDRDIGLFAAYFIAVSFWHTAFSRIAFRAIMVPAICSFALYFLITAIKKDRWSYYILGGFIFGLGFYTYYSYLIMPFVLLLFLFFLVLEKRENSGGFSTFYKGALAYLSTAIITLLPMSLFVLKNPDIYNSRISRVSSFNANNSGAPWKELLSSFWKTLLMFTYSGDQNPRHNLRGRPQLSVLVGIFFLLGLFLIIFYFYQAVRSKNWWKAGTYLLILSLWGCMLLPAILAQGGAPHSLRALGSVAPTYIIAAFGLKSGAVWLKDYLKKSPNCEMIITSFLIVVFLGTALLNFQDYFFKYANHPEIETAFKDNYVQTGEYLNRLSSDVQKYVLVNYSKTSLEIPEYPHLAQIVLFTTNDESEIQLVSLSDFPSIIEQKNGNYVIILPEYDPEIKSILSEKIHVELEGSFPVEGVYMLSHGEIK